ncbi:MAG: CvpA family protein [Anaerolineales bacterium]
MISLIVVFWMFVVLFGVIGAFRGWAKELLVVFSVVLALLLNFLLKKYVPIISQLPDKEPALFWIRALILVVLVFFGYQTVGMQHFAGKAAREKLQDSLLGFVFGAANGYLVVGTLWFYLDQAIYLSSSYITSPVAGDPMGDAAINLLLAMPPRLMGEPVIYFVVALAFVFVIVVFV